MAIEKVWLIEFYHKDPDYLHHSLFLDWNTMKRKQSIDVMINTIIMAGDKDTAVTDHVTS